MSVGAERSSDDPLCMSPRRVLLADDHESVRAGVAALLEASDEFTLVGTARDGREALEMASTLDPDVVLIDLSMPVVDGVEAIRRFAARTRSPRLVAFTGSSQLGSRALAAGAACCVFKDAPPRELLAALR
jgi:DNA-binding NarL/FixJ family response regulator